MKKTELLYEGKAKKIWKTDDENILIAEFKDSLTAFDAQKKSEEAGKGALNCKISANLFKLLEEQGIKTHFVECISENEMVIKKAEMIMIEVVVRNIATGSLTKRLGIPDGTKLPFALVEFYYKNDALHDPLINDEHALILELVDHESELEELKRLGREINVVLKSFFDKANLNLVDFKVEFGKDSEGNIILADEISPDSCRFWDKTSGEKLDKDLFRHDLGNVKVAYEEVLKRITKVMQ
ncbi:phosphoribosylaminoimidazolesuccinocarboxamide synthase [Nitratiruptor sp. SB155-2]|uniref:Phosphoribosylaminoimidazole-succinocarboxamide synthase n=1 Tax=Nitratiruptor sp. (strain SB155-2) TaxID=387092 RepID=PUR7_NITSB|nr:phosphoribosylaminoimidazolesuccinocarboxamide synthase [Nitratiruptor sp. SB155-2]A6Q3C7.1 RecName: Full=Phosphoribosylaminoimidazole-succinocarboxamide synthase; AltName: Full=SAICAR synthetase [Nitratiruptor sp. SB155-2]BAF69986.1 phosphoribosylaminoimidazole-succinocarboxamide synthase [Nitratiruptor sp. SB155-2]